MFRPSKSNQYWKWIKWLPNSKQSYPIKKEPIMTIMVQNHAIFSPEFHTETQSIPDRNFSMYILYIFFAQSSYMLFIFQNYCFVSECLLMIYHWLTTVAHLEKFRSSFSIFLIDQFIDCNTPGNTFRDSYKSVSHKNGAFTNWQTFLNYFE